MVAEDSAVEGTGFADSVPTQPGTAWTAFAPHCMRRCNTRRRAGITTQSSVASSRADQGESSTWTGQQSSRSLPEVSTTTDDDSHAQKITADAIRRRPGTATQSSAASSRTHQGESSARTGQQSSRSLPAVSSTTDEDGHAQKMADAENEGTCVSQQPAEVATEGASELPLTGMPNEERGPTNHSSQGTLVLSEKDDSHFSFAGVPGMREDDSVTMEPAAHATRASGGHQPVAETDDRLGQAGDSATKTAPDDSAAPIEANQHSVAQIAYHKFETGTFNSSLASVRDDLSFSNVVDVDS